MFQSTFNQTIKEAQKEIDRQAQRQRAPLVIWAGLEEPSDAFAARMMTLRKRWKGRILAAAPYAYPVPQTIQPVEFSPKTFWLLHPDASSRYRVASGGRGSGKSHGFADAPILRALSHTLRELCAREIQRSLRESVHKLLSSKIEKHGLSDFFEITDNQITCRPTGSEIIFAGLYQNTSQLKSLEGVGLCWIEESESVSKLS